MKTNVKMVIEAKRMLYGISRAELAAALQLSDRTLGVRLAKPETFTLRELRIVAKKLHCSIAMLAGEAPCDI